MTARIAWMRDLAPAMPNGSPPFRTAQLRRGSELSRQVPVDLEADADLNEGWGCPGHLVVFLSIPE